MWKTGTDLTPIQLIVPAVQALCDGQFFLEHLSVLRAVAIEPFCKRCHALGLVSTVSVLATPDEFTFRCQHTSGFVKRDRFVDVQPLLAALAWDLRCTRCAQLIEADNGKTDATFLVTCPCSFRTMANPTAQPAPPAPRVSHVGGVGRP